MPDQEQVDRLQSYINSLQADLEFVSSRDKAARDVLCTVKALVREPAHSDKDKIFTCLAGALGEYEKKHGYVPEAAFTWRVSQ